MGSISEIRFNTFNGTPIATNTYHFANPFDWSEMLDLVWGGGQLVKQLTNTPFQSIEVIVPANGFLPAADYSAANSFTQTAGGENSMTGVVALVRHKLSEIRAGYYNHIITELSQASALATAARELSGSKLLLESFVTLGLAESLESDDFVRALLFGGERLLDSSAITDLCNLGIEQSYDTNQNTRVNIAAILDERVATLETWLTNRLSQIQTNGHGESLRLVSSTLRRLEAFRAGWRFPSPPPYVAPLGHSLTNGIPNRLFVVYGEPNVRYTTQFSTNLVSTCNDTRYMAGCCGWHETRPKLHVVRKPGNSWSGWLAVGPNPSK